MGEAPMTAADVGAVLNGRSGGWGDGMGGGFWIFALIVLAFMGRGGFGWGGNEGGNVVTEAALCNANSFNELKSQVGRMNDQQAAIARQQDNAICNLGYTALQNTNAIQQQISSCCCDIKELVREEGNATRALMQQNKIEALQAQVAELKDDIRMQGVIKYPQGFCYSAQNPFFGSNCNCGNPLF